MKKVLITNAVMVNNGDAGLVLNLANAFKKNNYDVTIATHNFQFAVKNYSGYKFCRDVVGSILLGKRNVFAYIAIPILMLFNKSYRSADIIVGAPGGYINSFYGFKWKLHVFKYAKKFRKKTLIYSQSIGPLNSNDKAFLSYYSKFIDLILVRDQLSLANAKEAGVIESKLVLSEDAIFLQKPITDKKITIKTKKACISVRDWNFDGRSSDHYFKIIRGIIYLALEEGYQIDFLSTCQGVMGYIDDADTASRIVHTLDDSIKNKVRVVNDYFNVSDLQENIRRYDFVVGTRLHMCLLSILNGVPAFNISYEAKGKECYQYLGASVWSVDYNEDYEETKKRFGMFIGQLDEVKYNFSEAVLNKHFKAVSLFKKVSYAVIDCDEIISQNY
jgi:colanic acid/amylovoran biosynthesis protein